MAENRNKILDGNSLGANTDPESLRVIRECAAGLAIIACDQGIKRLQFIVGIADATQGLDIGDWRMTIERIDNNYMIQ